ncbi:MAG: Arc family DNA binding domain-containing protein [Atopobiaceae bacterium]|nr:Arc family DNA binding domain-containing protein [Atopobiaceae bacterium]
MAKRKQYPLRIDPDVWEAVQKWAADDMRSANGQVEFILRRALREAGRLPAPSGKKSDGASDESATQTSQKI